jgi:opacity protein-like surface antigen
MAPTLATALRSAELGCAGVEVSMADTAIIGARLRMGHGWLLRPSFAYWRQTADNVPALSDIDAEPPVYRTTEQYFGLGLGLGYEVPIGDSLRASVTGSVRRGRTDANYAGLDAEGLVVVRNGPLTQWDADVSAGCEYAVGRRFALFGQAGLRYSHGERFAFDGLRLKDSTWTTATTGLGIVFYLW